MPTEFDIERLPTGALYSAAFFTAAFNASGSAAQRKPTSGDSGVPRLPYVDDTELVMDILRQGDEVQVTEPAELVQAVRRRLAAAVAQYTKALSISDD